MKSDTSFLFYYDQEGEPLYLEHPIDRISARSYADVLPTLLKIDALAQENKYYLAGYLSYEAGYPLMGIEPKWVSKQPLVDFFVFEKKSTPPKTLNEVTAFYDFSKPEEIERYDNNMDRIRQNLIKGNTYQVNYTFQNSCRSYGETKSLFLNLFKAQPSRYAVCAELPEFDVLSVSPELFFSKVDNVITAKPMKGTLPLNTTEIPKEISEKLKSENMMIVDLIRNDLSKLAKPETVRVTQLMETERYPTLQQIVSTIEGEVPEDVLFSKVIKALFPCGSITGAPKFRTMEIIQQLEKTPRGIYTGTIGYITPDNDMQFNVAIRTLCGRGEWSYGVGGGIVLDSNVDDEYQEAILKSRFIRKANSGFYLFETMLAQDGTVIDISEHMVRLSESALVFGFLWNEEKILLTLTKSLSGQINQERVKLKLFADGDVEVEKSEILDMPSIRRVAISPVRVESNNLFLQHKTSRRDLYDDTFLFSKARGYYDVIFMNERSEITEASRHSVFARFGDKWFTPPVSCGLLPGIARRKRIKEYGAEEKILHVSDLHEADEIVLTNSIRGAVTVEVEL